jgi:hypothetical protein
MHQTRYVTNRSINRMGLNINKKYDNEFIPVVKNIIADFNLTNNIKS